MHPRLLSRNGVPIRLTEERWQHIIEEHPEIDGLLDSIRAAVTQPERVLLGSAGERLAVRTIEPGKAIDVVYRETSPEDGFVTTAFLTRRFHALDKRDQLWPLR